ncbi:hypothetical protein FHW77_000061 [Agrobacterium sp. RC10-4-1]|uniref:Uncharacterized protein n=1 Tax=Agrobacterium pusense TaxID=648995 RepID=U4Q3T4_9HYPH|nr:hypothetical protein [Agrobacterium sp. RC10-4-1]MCJ2874509.1 hypothetical protein [Agrobacterium pusense]OAI84489.1 hypothetical protein AYO27_14855 [Rhizobium sp. GHKF11]CDI10693.1 conserved membrane protein of unknown function [Agrobacterium pusense]
MAHFESLARLLNASPVLTGISGCSRIWCFPASASALVSVPFATSISMSAIIAAAVAVAATVRASVSAAVTAISVSIAAAVVSSAITAVIPVTVAAAVVPSAITAVIPVTVAAAIALSDSNPNTSGLQELDSDQRNHGPSDHGKGEEVLKHVSSCTHSVLHICRPAGMDANQLSLRRLPEFGSVEN